MNQMTFYNNSLVSFLLIAFVSVLISGCATPEQTGRPAETELNIFQFMGEIEQAKFTSLEGDTVRISDFRGNVVMIDFWETWCKPCTNSFPALEKLLNEYPDNFTVLAVTPGWKDDADDAKDFAEDHDYSFNYLMDATNLHTQIGVQSIPYKIFLDKDGNFIKTSLGSRGAKSDYEKVKQIIEKYKAK